MQIKPISRFYRILLSNLILLIAALLPIILVVGATAQDKCKRELAAAEEKYQLRQFDEVMRLLAACLKKQDLPAKDRIPAYHLLAKTLYAKGELDKAEKVLQQILRLEPDWKPDSDLDPPSFQEYAKDIIAQFKRGVRQLTPTAVLPDDSPHDYALVIGIDKYSSSKWPKLGYAKKDAEAVAYFLRDQNFQVTLIYDELATKTEIISQLQNALAPKLREKDRVLFFFAGHGYTETLGGEDHGYIVPSDGGERSATYISMDELHTQSKMMRISRHQLFIFDSCYGGSFGTRAGFLNPSSPAYLFELMRRPSREFITAGGKNQQVREDVRCGHGLFTCYLLKALKDGFGDTNNDGYITFHELAGYIVPAASDRYQTPSAANLPGHELGEFIFRSPKRDSLSVEAKTNISHIDPLIDSTPNPMKIYEKTGSKWPWITIGGAIPIGIYVGIKILGPDKLPLPPSPPQSP